MPAPCGWDDYNVTGAVNWQAINGALVGGPLANDYYSDNRSYYQTNEVDLDYIMRDTRPLWLVLFNRNYSAGFN